MTATGGSEEALRAALREQHAANAALTLENTRLRAALAAAEARAQLAPAEDDYPSAVFRELWRVLATLRAGTGEEGRA
jgi:regulator of replication initiation timing